MLDREGGTEGGALSHDVHIRTFLIADVRGYTLFTQERGDEAAAALASRFALLAREGVEARGGVVVELRGDEALAVFDSARQAIRASVELQRRFVDETVAEPSLPLAVGIGLDAGEAVPVDGGYRGGALNLAARLCSIAGPAEILASPAVTHLARTREGDGAGSCGCAHLPADMRVSGSRCKPAITNPESVRHTIAVRDGAGTATVAASPLLRRLKGPSGPPALSRPLPLPTDRRTSTRATPRA